MTIYGENRIPFSAFLIETHTSPARCVLIIAGEVPVVCGAIDATEIHPPIIVSLAIYVIRLVGSLASHQYEDETMECQVPAKQIDPHVSLAAFRSTNLTGVHFVPRYTG